MRPVVPLAVAAALAAGALSLATAASAHPDGSGVAGRDVPTTQRVVVRPVDATGHAVAGWSVSRERGFTVSCAGAARAAVDDDILLCSPSAVYAPACWKSRHHTTLCLRDARTRKLVRLRYSGSFEPATALGRPSPQDLDLGSGAACDIRVGGAWGQIPSHPNWVGFYSCPKGDVYGPLSGDGVNRHHPRWTVHLWNEHTDRITTRGVRTAYYVGTAP
jgi:hypothetical protein